jgi:hypothetical protein
VLVDAVAVLLPFVGLTYRAFWLINMNQRGTPQQVGHCLFDIAA